MNVAVGVLTGCKIKPHTGREIHLKSHDTGREERFGSLDELLAAKTYKHGLAAYLVRLFSRNVALPSRHIPSHRPALGFPVLRR